MLKIKSIILIGLLLNSLTAFCQAGLKNAPGTKYISTSTSDTFLISTKPITNREYIIYILWLKDVYGADYTAAFLNSFPGITSINIESLIYEAPESKTPFEVILRYSPAFVKNYIFNAKYIDYPIIGLSSLQASRFCKWLSDRYNENKLIQHGYFSPNPNQINEDCFVTESYVVNQYYGARIKEETVKWSDRLLIPIFRLPTKKELNIAMAKKSANTEFKPYPYDTTSFLNYWNQLYLDVSASSLTVKYYNNKTELIKSTDNVWEIKPQDYEELTLDVIKAKEIKHIKDYYGIEKDSLAQMPFIIIDENSNKEPIIAENYLLDNSVIADQNKLYFFRFACSIKPKQFKQ
jgi:hypothetical protein